MTQDAQQPTPRAAKRGNTKLRYFLQSSVFDYLLVLICSVTLMIAASFAFESAPSIRGNALVNAGIAVPMLAILFAGSWSKKALVPSAIGAVIYGAAVLIVCMVLTPADTPMFVDAGINDVAENYVVYGFVAIVVPVLVYLLSRRRIGVLVLFVAAVLTFTMVQFMYRDWITSEPAALVSVIGYIAVGALFIFQGYRSSVYQARRIKKVTFGKATLFAALTAAVCMGLGVLFFVAVISPLGLSTPELKPFKDYYIPPTIEYTGIYDEQSVDNPDIVTSNVNDNDNDSNQDAKGGKQTASPKNNDDSASNPISDLIQQLSNFDQDDWNQVFNTISFTKLALNLMFLLVLLAIPIVAIVLLWRRRRVKRLEKIADEPDGYKVWFIYEFLVERMRRLGLKRPENLTLLEYAMASRNQLAPFAQGTDGIDFLALTLAYQRAVYGGNSSPEDVQMLETYYKAFFKNAFHYVGKRRWIIKFWRM